MFATFFIGVARSGKYLFYLCFIVSFMGCSSPIASNVVELNGPTMGTEWRISLGAANLAHATLSNPESELRISITSSVINELQRINDLMSTWDPESALSQFNESRSTKPTAWHSDSILVLQTALGVSQATDGVYDVTRGRVFQLWGFGASVGPEQTPSSDELAYALSQSGWQSIVIKDGTVAKQHRTLTIDFSSLAKGYAVDQLAAVLESFGIEHYIVNIGGEIKVRGERSENEAWKIGVEQPNATVASGIALNHAQLATSGSYRNVRLVNGERIPHLIDGRTGQPITHPLVAATVLHESTMLADAWSTAYMVLGAEKAQAHAVQQNLAVQLTQLSEPGEAVSADPEFTVWQSPEWQKLDVVTLE